MSDDTYTTGPSGLPLCPVALFRNDEMVGAFTDEGRALDYRDWHTHPDHDARIAASRKREDSWGT